MGSNPIARSRLLKISWLRESRRKAAFVVYGHFLFCSFFQKASPKTFFSFAGCFLPYRPARRGNPLVLQALAW
ncbi:hypothetical protein [Komagataeibacter xylinus]|uniref:hypothetical protein n=1 Tax=Komagataeibacter xylinus TaxID=28448 RepID=UPI001013D38C|nr:hypothetical protein [Komagataeibacter xylinus]